MAAITLAQAATLLHSRLKNLSNEVRQSASDESANGYGPDLDQALRRMDAADVADLTLNKEVSAFLVIARYYALSRFASLLATRVDTEGYAVEGDRQSIFGNISDLIEMAAREAAAYGYVLEADSLSLIGAANEDIDQGGTTTAWARGVLDTGFLAPNDPYVWPYDGWWL